MRGLSNLLSRGDGAEPIGPVEYRPARPSEAQGCLALILGSQGNPAPPEQVIDFLQFAELRGIDIRDLWVVARAGRPLWAMLPILSPGHTALLFVPGHRPASADVGPLIERVCGQIGSAGVHLAQVLLDPPDTSARNLYASHGFREMAELLYLLRVDAGHSTPAPEFPPGYWLQTYSPQTHALFERAILESYQQSLDCPGLNGLRHIDDIIAGHKASGDFDPRFWFILSEGDIVRGVLLLSRVTRTDTAELVYLGLSPTARGHGLGDLLVRQAFWATRQMHLDRLTLAVDSRNAPALNLYHRHGMRQIGSKIALMRDLRDEHASA